MDNPTNRATERTPMAALSHAAQCLAKAAVTLSEAAQAMSAAAERLTLDYSKPPGQNNEAAKERNAASLIVSYESESESSSMEADAETGHVSLDASKSLRNEPAHEECTDPEEASYSNSDPGDNLTQHSTSQRVNTNPDRIGQIENQNISINHAYRMLVEHEVDVLLFTCALIGSFQKTVCYMHCSIPTFSVYQKLISDVTEVPVHTLNKLTTTEIERVGREFLSKERSVILLPESVAPQILLDKEDSCVVHVGWPAKDHIYTSQLQAHRARNNVVIACAEDKDLYLAGAAIIQLTHSWPGNTGSFQTSTTILRPLFDQKLAELPHELKAKIYTEWISFHGASGRGYVASWTPSVLVYRANLYLLDVLRYSAPRGHSGDAKYALQVPLPEVSTGFVTANGLEPAVEEGILRVEQASLSLNHISSLSRDDRIPVGTTSLNETPPTNNQTSTYSNSGVDSLSKPSPAPSEWDGTPSTPAKGKTFLPTPGYTHFALEEEFDAIPLICFLALTYATEKVIIFLDDFICLPQYQKLIGKITGQTVMVTPGIIGDDQAQSNQNVALAFMTCQTPVVLLLSYRLSKFPPALENSTVGCCVYWAATDHAPLSQAQRNGARLSSYATHIIMTTAQRDLKGSKMKVPEHPSSSDLVDYSASSWLSPMRETTRSILIDNQQIAKGLYGAHCYLVGRMPRTALSAEKAAHRLNRYSTRILLRGNIEDGSERFPPVSGGFPTPAKHIRTFDLQPAVDAGLLTVG